MNRHFTTYKECMNDNDDQTIDAYSYICRFIYVDYDACSLDSR